MTRDNCWKTYSVLHGQRWVHAAIIQETHASERTRTEWNKQLLAPTPNLSNSSSHRMNILHIGECSRNIHSQPTRSKLSLNSHLTQVDLLYLTPDVLYLMFNKRPLQIINQFQYIIHHTVQYIRHRSDVLYLMTWWKTSTNNQAVTYQFVLPKKLICHVPSF